MSYARRLKSALTGLAGAIVLIAAVAFATAGAKSANLPNPYHEVTAWAKLPAGVMWGGVISVDSAPNGDVWVFYRSDPPILRFDQSGKVVKSFGAGLFAQAHGMTVDRDGNVWVTDAQTKDGKGQQVFKFSPDGKVLMTLGKAGVARDGPDTFNMPSAVAIGSNGVIFAADGHGGDSNARIVKFSKDGKFIKTWGKKGQGAGEFETPHSLAFDSKGRLFVADRGNHRIQIFNQDGEFLDQWKQFGQASGIFIDKNDVMYVADNESNSTRNPGFKRGIRIGSAKDGSVTAFIPDPEPDPDHTDSGAAEGVGADASGNIYGSEVVRKTVMKYVRK